ncbi:MAG TPA: hypothetical protein VIJ75_00820 [Hanamia sp.]
MPDYFKVFFLFAVIFLSACGNDSDKKASDYQLDATGAADSIKSANKTSASISDFGYFKLDGDSLIIPSFEIGVKLSSNAKAKLLEDKETIIVSASFMGVPKDTTSAAFLESGEIGIAGKDMELRNDDIAKFENIKFSKLLYDSLSDKDIQLLINVFSGRRSSTDNVLSCGIVQEKMSKVKGKKFTIDCKLIYGED